MTIGDILFDVITSAASVISALAACVAAWFSMRAATANERHHKKIRSKKHDLYFIIHESYRQFTLAQIIADMACVIPDLKTGERFLLGGIKLSDYFVDGFIGYDIDDEIVIYADVKSDKKVTVVRHEFSQMKWFKFVGFTKQGSKKHKIEKAEFLKTKKEKESVS